MNEEKLISLKENFTGQRFQWIKTDRPELLGKLVKCRDIVPNRLGGFDVIFDDGSKIDSTRLNLNLMMLHSDMQPLTRSEVESINGSSAKKAASPPVSSNPQIQAELPTSPNLSVTAVPAHAPKVESQTLRPAQKPNLFAAFNSETTQITLSMAIKLPNKKLLKMMYHNSEDKEKFLDDLSDYLQGLINKQVVLESITEMIDPAAPKMLKK